MRKLLLISFLTNIYFFNTLFVLQAKHSEQYQNIVDKLENQSERQKWANRELWSKLRGAVEHQSIEYRFMMKQCVKIINRRK